MAIYNYVNGVKVEITDKEVIKLYNLETDAEKDSAIELRNTLLAETDWMALEDVTMTDAWKTYRQALRDLPAADGFPDVDFPTKPS